MLELDLPSLISRWLRLHRYDRDAWKEADRVRSEGIWAAYGARQRRIEALRARIMLRYHLLKAESDPGFQDKTVTWGPTEMLETHDAERLVCGVVPPWVPKHVPEEVDSWRRLPSVDGDSESSQGFLYTDTKDLDEVVRRLKTLGCKPRVSDSVTISPPSWGVPGCWPIDKPSDRPIAVSPLLRVDAV